MKIVIIGSVNPRGYAGDPIFLWIFSFFGKLFVWIISFFLPLGDEADESYRKLLLLDTGHTLLAREFWKVRLYRLKSRQCRTPR